MITRTIHHAGRVVALALALALVAGVLFSLLGSAVATPPLGMPMVLADEAQPVVRMMIFHTNSCSNCVAIMEEFLPSIKEVYGQKLEIVEFEISDPTNMQLLVALEQAYGVPQDRATIPEVFMGRDVFLGAGAIEQELVETIEEYLAQGGVDWTPPMVELISSVATPQPREGVVRASMFYMSTCGHCHEVIEEVLPILKQRYGDQFEIKLINVDLDEHWEQYERLIEELRNEPGLVGVPGIIIGTEVMVGTGEIGENVERLIQQHLAEGGIDFPEIPASLDGPLYELDTSLPTATVPPTPLVTPTADPSKAIINMAYFFQPGCQECDRVSVALGFMSNRYPQLEIARYDIGENAELNEWLSERASVDEALRLVAPALFVGDQSLVDAEITLDNLESLIEAHVTTGSEPIWTEFEEGSADKGIRERFKSMGVLTVVGAGLIDGLNPCAFATIVFFISYLSLSGRKGRELLLVGGSFTLGVFLTYLGVGLGLTALAQAVGFMATFGRWVYALTAIICLVLAGLSFSDYVKARRGEAGDMSLSLPTALRKRINAVIRKSQSARAFVLVAFATGVAISIIEFACTGQVYLPTIVFVLGDPELQAQATIYLLLYNIFFVVPLIVVFALAYFGTTSEQFGAVLRKHASKVKLATAILFLALAGWLIYALLT